MNDPEDTGRGIAKANGKHLGSRPKLTRAQKKEILVRLSEGVSVTEMSQSFGVSRATIYNTMKKDDNDGASYPMQSTA
ncbi:MAG: helix-turn-helix domain-containing protein [Desulfovermiculus sp.]|nr:helix-turn-helix domain-containing protein [Desulfovermiculus sp.]